MTMNLFGARQKQLLSFLTANAERETLDYVLQGMKEVLREDMPEEDVVRAYLQNPDEPSHSARNSRSWRWTSCWSVRRSISECSAT